MRAELTPAEHADHLARRKELWASRENGQTLPVSGIGKGEAGPGRGKKGFASETAKKTGMSKRAINLALSRAKAIPADVRDKIKGTHLDRGTYLDSLKGMTPDDQRAQVRRNLAEPKRRARNLVATHARISGLQQLPL